MLPITIASLLVALVMTTVASLTFRKLRETEHELERTRSRMARLDEVADGLADLEYSTTREEPRVQVDSGQYVAIGLQFDTEDVFDDELEFAPPQMASEVVADRRQKPSRPHHKTPAGSPQTFAPRSANSVVAVGSIQVRQTN